VLIEFVFEELLDANGVFDTVCVVDEEPQGDTDILGLKVTVELADGHDESIVEGVNPRDTDGHDVWEEFDDDDKVNSEEGVGVNRLVLDWILELDCTGVIEFDTEADELTEPEGLAETWGDVEEKGDAVSEILWAPVWEARGVWENVSNEEAELEYILDTDTLCVVDDEIDTELEPE